MHDQEHASGQDEYENYEDRIIDGERVISYNVKEEFRPGGMKVRYKLTVVTGQRGREIELRQLQAIREVLEWSRQHRQQRPPQ
jgi:hypothetical protein